MTMTDEEREIVTLLANVWNKFSALPAEGLMDSTEFAHHIHILQRQVMSRCVRREVLDK